MAIRKDGIDTYKKILKAASAVFAEKGYRNTTVAEICRRAGSNIASINYHFGSKDDLYTAVWKNAFDETMKVYPPDGGLPDDAKPQERLHAMVYSLLHSIMDESRLGHAGQILLKEMSNPTEVIHQVHEDVVGPLRERMHGIIKELIGDKATKQQINFCELSVIHQCIAPGFRKSKERLAPFFANGKITPEIIHTLAEHITFFSLAGIAAVRDRIEC